MLGVMECLATTNWFDFNISWLTRCVLSHQNEFDSGVSGIAISGRKTDSKMGLY